MNDILETLQRNEIDAAKDSHDRRWACDATSDDYFRYSKDAAEHTKNAIEIQRLEYEHEIELRKIELEEMKGRLNGSGALNDPKYWIENVAIPVGMQGLKLFIWATMFTMATKYEKTDISTLSGMKGVMRVVGDSVTGVFKGDRV